MEPTTRIDWSEVADLVIACLKVLIVATVAAGCLTRMAWDALPGLSEHLGQWFSAQINGWALPAYTLAEATCRDLQVLTGTRRHLPKQQLLAIAVGAA
jgi:hypothetical protein